MQKLALAVFLMSSFMRLSFAYEMHGTMSDNNDGTYQVNMVSSNGREYLGLADLQGDGTLNIDVAIQNGGSEIYLGTATLNASGNYDLYLRNNTTGEIATGTLEKSS